MSNEHIIISNLIYNTEYCTEVLPFVKEEYFQDRPNLLDVQDTPGLRHQIYQLSYKGYFIN